MITGSVRSSDTSEPLPGTTIRVIGTALGTTTNGDGRYRLLLKQGRYGLQFSYIGFESDTAWVDVTLQDTSLNVFLRRSQIPLPEVVVYPSPFNPADEVIRRAVAAKREWRSRLASYSFDAYTKTVLRVDTGRKGNGTMIAGILETQTKGYWKSPGSYREVVTAKRQTANFSSSQNIFTVGRVLNFNDDVVKIDRFSIPGPISPSALKRYNFTMLDTIWQGATRIFRLAITPKESVSPMFRGIIDIADGSFALVHSRLVLSDPTALDPLRDVVYDEQFAEYENSFWLPIAIRTTFVVKFVVPPVPPVLFENTSVLYDYKLNPEFPGGFFYRDFAFPSTADLTGDSTAWKSEQILPLTRQEVSAYARLDSIARNMPVYLKAIVFLSSLPDQVASLPITSFSDFYHFNRVEGNYLGIGLRNSAVTESMDFTATGGYGFSDRMWKSDLAVDYRFPFADGVTVGGSVFRRLANRPEEDIYSRFEVTIGALLYRDDYRDYYLSTGWNGYMHWRLSSSWKAAIQFNDEKQSSVHKNTDYSLFSEDHGYDQNPPIDDGWMRSVTLSLALDTRQYSGTGMSMQSDEGSNYWVGEVSAELSSPGFLNSSFSFRRYELSLMRHQMTFASCFLNLWTVSGFSEGSLPVQRMFEIQASYGGYSEQQVLSTLDTRRILSGHTIVAGIEHDIPSTLFRSSDVPVIRSVWFDVALFAHGAAAEDFSPMDEVGFGLVNIIPLIRTDFTWGVAGLCKGFAWTLQATLSM